ncbi:unnamed protein product, partial [Allacma fusca]
WRPPLAPSHVRSVFGIFLSAIQVIWEDLRMYSYQNSQCVICMCGKFNTNNRDFQSQYAPKNYADGKFIVNIHEQC